MDDPSSHPERALDDRKTGEDIGSEHGYDEWSPVSEVPLLALAISEDPMITELITDLLGKDGVRAISCGNGPEGIELFQRLRPGLAAIDLGQSPAERLETFRTLKTIDRHVPVILIVNHEDREAAIRGIEQGAYDFVERPADPRLLRFTLRRGLVYSGLVQSERSHKRLLEETLDEKTLEVVRKKEFLQGILDSSTLVSVVLTDLSQNVLFWNSGAENIFGYTADEMIGESITKLYPPDTKTHETVEQLRKMVGTRTGTVYGKMRQRKKDETELIISLALSPMLDASGELRGILGVGLDVTEEARRHEELEQSFDLIKLTQDVTIFSLAKLAESRDEETGFHLLRIREYCRTIAQGLACRDEYCDVLTSEFIDDLVRSSVLHDIGKVGIPDSILMCPRKFSPEEFEKMKRHSIIGGQALDDAVKELGEKSFLSHARDIAYYHHERWDGSGYPFGKKGEDIPLSARIVALADVYDALTSERRYKEAFSHGEALDIIQDGSGKHFDPELVTVFLENEGAFDQIRAALSS